MATDRNDAGPALDAATDLGALIDALVDKAGTLGAGAGAEHCGWTVEGGMPPLRDAVMRAKADLAEHVAALESALAREGARAATMRARLQEIAGILNAPMWEEDDEDIVCRCDGCRAETAALAAKYRCAACGYEGQPMAWGCRDARNLAEMAEERGERYDAGNILCPVCGSYELEADPWQAIRSIRVALIGLPDAALAADAPGDAGRGGGEGCLG